MIRNWFYHWKAKRSVNCSTVDFKMKDDHTLVKCIQGIINWKAQLTAFKFQAVRPEKNCQMSIKVAQKWVL